MELFGLNKCNTFDLVVLKRLLIVKRKGAYMVITPVNTIAEAIKKTAEDKKMVSELIRQGKTDEVKEKGYRLFSLNVNK